MSRGRESQGSGLSQAGRSREDLWTFTGSQGGIHKKRSEGISLARLNGARSQSRGRVGRRTCGRGPHPTSVCGRRVHGLSVGRLRQEENMKFSRL